MKNKNEPNSSFKFGFLLVTLGRNVANGLATKRSLIMHFGGCEGCWGGTCDQKGKKWKITLDVNISAKNHANIKKFMSFQKNFSKALIWAQAQHSSFLCLKDMIVPTQPKRWNHSILVHLVKNYFRGQYLGQNSLKYKKIYELSKELFKSFNLGWSATF